MPRDTTIPLHCSTGDSDSGVADRCDTAVLMSGGADSTAAAALLCRAGWRIVGVTMRIPLAAAGDGNDETERIEDTRGAPGVCRQLGVPHYYLDTRDVFRRDVIENFRQSYLNGQTPNPCVLCNARLKFGYVWDLLESQFGIRYLATGHYARVETAGRTPRLRRGEDINRDQSYFLYRIPRHRLPYLLLPLGTASKDWVREQAREYNVEAADKPDSMDLCFAEGNDYRRILGGRTGARGYEPGPILDLSGKQVGAHNGICRYTIGQRRGLGIAAEEPLYVVGIDPQRNSLTIGPRSKVFASTIYTVNPNLLLPDATRPGRCLYGKIRSYMTAAACCVQEADADRLTVVFDEPQFAPAPGQHLVLYEDDGSVVGGGEISESHGQFSAGGSGTGP